VAPTADPVIHCAGGRDLESPSCICVYLCSCPKGGASHLPKRPLVAGQFLRSGKTILRSLASIKAVELWLTRWSEPSKALVKLNLEVAICDECVNDFKLEGPGARHGAPTARGGRPRWFLIGHDLLKSNCVDRGVALDQAGIGEGCVSRRYDDVSFSE